MTFLKRQVKLPAMSIHYHKRLLSLANATWCKAAGWRVHPLPPRVLAATVFGQTALAYSTVMATAICPALSAFQAQRRSIDRGQKLLEHLIDTPPSAFACQTSEPWLGSRQIYVMPESRF